MEAKLDLIQSLGAVGVKLAIEHGFGASGGAPAQFTPELMQALVQGARRRGLPLYVHAMNEAAQSEALDLGAHALMHAALDAVSPTPLSDAFVARLRAERRLPAHDALALRDLPEPVRPRAARRSADAARGAAQLELETAAGARCARSLRDRRDRLRGALDLRVHAALDRAGLPLRGIACAPRSRMAQQNLLRLHRAGVPIVVATDAPSPWPDAIHHFHGVQTLEEVLLLGEAGFAPLEAIAPRPAMPARMLGLDAEIGALAPGMRAEIALVEGAPDRDLRALRRVRWTVQGDVARTPAEWMAAP